VSPWVRRVDCESKEHGLALPDMLNQCHCTLNVTFLAALSEGIVPLERVQRPGQNCADVVGPIQIPCLFVVCISVFAIVCYLLRVFSASYLGLGMAKTGRAQDKKFDSLELKPTVQ
jgi:hypothetical protein